MKMRTCVFCGGFGVRHMDVKIGVTDSSHEFGGVAGEGVWEATIDVCGQCRQMTTVQMGSGILRSQLENPTHEQYESLGSLCAGLLMDYRRYYQPEIRSKMWERRSLDSMSNIALKESRLTDQRNREIALKVLHNLEMSYKRLILLCK